MMSALTQDERFSDVLKEEGGKPKNMCEVLDRVEEKGRQRGIQEGRQEGIDQNRIENIRSIMAGLKCTSKQAMDLLKIPADDQKKYLAKIERNARTVPK